MPSSDLDLFADLAAFHRAQRTHHQVGAKAGQLIGQFAGCLAPDSDAFGHQDGAGIETHIHMHHHHAGFDVAGHHGALDGSGAAPAQVECNARCDDVALFRRLDRRGCSRVSSELAVVAQIVPGVDSAGMLTECAEVGGTELILRSSAIDRRRYVAYSRGRYRRRSCPSPPAAPAQTIAAGRLIAAHRRPRAARKPAPWRCNRAARRDHVDRHQAGGGCLALPVIWRGPSSGGESEFLQFQMLSSSFLSWRPRQCGKRSTGHWFDVLAAYSSPGGQRRYAREAAADAISNPGPHNAGILLRPPVNGRHQQ